MEWTARLQDCLSQETEPAALPHIFPRFHIPRLVNNPQNPILDTLKSKRAADASNAIQFTAIPPKIVSKDELKPLTADLLWETALKPERKVSKDQHFSRMSV
jgi:hypothetical protein